VSPDEALRICRLAKALSPAQAVDEYTPEAWALVLRDVRYSDAEAALVELGGEREWIHVSHIKARVRRIRDERMRTFGTIPDPPDEVCADAERYHHWYADTVRAIRDGSVTRDTWTPPAIAAPTREQKAALRELVAETKRGLTKADGTAEDDAAPRRATEPGKPPIRTTGATQ
jgi:hypothetical protein